MARPRAGGPTVSSGRRGYLRYQYGSHFWIPETLADFSQGMVRDTAREAIPPGGVYDAADYLLHQPGVAQKRGGTTYAGPAMTGAGTAVNVIHAPFAAGAQLLAVGDNGHVYKITAGTTTDIGTRAGSNVYYLKPTTTPGAKHVVFPNDGGTAHDKYDGTTFAASASAVALLHTANYKSRLVGASGNAGEQNRNYFSGTPDVNAAWDTANSYIDSDNPISGYAALNNALLIFSNGAMERIIGATPPPNSDMDRAPVSPVGCTDCRSIVQVGPYVYFANPEGVYLTNGSTPVSLTEQGGISSYWRSLFDGYVTAAPVPSSSTWTIAAGWYRGFLFVTVLNELKQLQSTLMCNLARRAWWRLTNLTATSYATSVDGSELYYGNGDTNRVTKLAGIFTPGASNKNDANGVAVAPTIEFAPVGRTPGVKSYGFGRLDFYMNDVATDNPTMAIGVKGGIKPEAGTFTTPAESPLLETTVVDRRRFSICQESQSITISLAQTNASGKTEIYALEVEQRPQSLVGDGIT